jgi:hypothetical protein
MHTLKDGLTPAALLNCGTLGSQGDHINDSNNVLTL